MPPSFKGADGKIVYSLEARLSRSMRIDQKDLTKINFVPNANWSPEHNLRVGLELMYTFSTHRLSKCVLKCPRYQIHFSGLLPGATTRVQGKKDESFYLGKCIHGCEPGENRFLSRWELSDSQLHFCSHGNVRLENQRFNCVYTGEGISVLACIQNNSSREIKPKYCLYRKHSFFAEGKRRVHTKDLLKEVGNPIPPSASEKVTRVITIPQDIEPSIFNCSIIKAEHRLRVRHIKINRFAKFSLEHVRILVKPLSFSCNSMFYNVKSLQLQQLKSIRMKSVPFFQVYLDVKYASDPEIKFPIVILRAPTVSAAPPFPTASAPYPAAAFGFGNTALPQPPPAPPNPFDPPPSYGTYNLYPPISGFGNNHQGDPPKL